MPFFGGDSSATDRRISVQDQGQVNQRADVAQGGSLLLGRKSSLALPGSLQGVKLDKGASLTLNIGPSTDELSSLLQSVPAPAPAPAPPPATPAPAPVVTDAKAVEEKPGVPVWAFGLIAVGLLWFLKK